MYILTNEQMRAADAYTIEQLGVPSLLLMERAGLALAEAAGKWHPKAKSFACAAAVTTAETDLFAPVF